MKRFATICVLMCSVVSVCNAAVQFSDCGSGTGGQLLQVHIPQCGDDGSGRCFLRRGQQVTILARFRPFVNSKNAVTVIEGDLNGFVVPFPIQQRDACVYSGLQCPIRAGQIYTYQLSMPLSTEYPALDIDVRVAVEGDQGELFCAQVPARLQ